MPNLLAGLGNSAAGSPLELQFSVIIYDTIRNVGQKIIQVLIVLKFGKFVVRVFLQAGLQLCDELLMSGFSTPQRELATLFGGVQVKKCVSNGLYEGLQVVLDKIGKSGIDNVSYLAYGDYAIRRDGGRPKNHLFYLIVHRVLQAMGITWTELSASDVGLDVIRTRSSARIE